MNRDQPALTLTIPSDPGMLCVARSFVETACQVGEYDKSTIFATVMATGEAFTNIIHHAHRDLDEATLQIKCWLGEDGIELWFIDQGPPFDIASVPHLPPGEVRVGGRGVYMMRSLMDEVSSSLREGGNVLRMVKYRKSSSNVRDCG